MIGLRRNMMAQKVGGVSKDYIKDGLVFELNATKGLSADGWIEQISGKTFTWTEGSNQVFSPQGVEIGSAIGANGSFMECENSTFDWIAMSECTMDICFQWGTKEFGTQVFNFGVNKGFSFTMYGDGMFYHCGTPSTGCWMFRTNTNYNYSSRIVMNYSTSSLITDKVAALNHGIYPNRNTSSNTGSMAKLGCNPDGTYPVTDIIIRAIRIYNRPLTEEEIIHNYDLDSKLFNL